MSIGSRAGVIASASPSMPSAASTPAPSASSMIIRCPSMRLRIAIVSTLPSSNAKALMMWRCSGSDIERKNSRAWL
jgi:hypothetical protein